MIFKSIKTDQIRKQNPANVPWDTFFPKKQVKLNYSVLKTTWYDLKPESLRDPNDTLKTQMFDISQTPFWRLGAALLCEFTILPSLTWQ